jgi:hypothetical protein
VDGIRKRATTNTRNTILMELKDEKRFQKEVMTSFEITVSGFINRHVNKTRLNDSLWMKNNPSSQALCIYLFILNSIIKQRKTFA